MKLGEPVNLEITLRHFDFSRQHAIRDVYDALVELITNSDDSYHRLYKRQFIGEDGGSIFIEICEQRKGEASLIVIYDRAEGMTLETMRNKLCYVGSRQSEEGDRGFMGRGAKDCTALGRMILESIKDEKYYKCELTTKYQFIPWKNGDSVNKEMRERLGIVRGNGTVVTLEIATQHRIPHVGKIIQDLPWHYALRDILSEHSPTKLLIKNLNNKNMKPEPVIYMHPEGELVCDENFIVPGYPEAKARLKIWRAIEPFEDLSDRFRRSGLLIKGERAIYECSLLCSGLEKEPYAKRYFGRLECNYIDRLLNEYDKRRENKELQHPPENPSLLADPHRQEGLRRDHPFTKALFQIPSEKLRWLIEKDKEQNKGTQREIANKETKKRLDELAKAAGKFLAQQVEELEELTIDDKVDEDFFSKKGVLIFPTYLNVAIGQIRSLTFYVNRSIFDKEAHEVMVVSDDPAITILDAPFKLRLHPKRSNMLIGTFRIRGEILKDVVCLQTKSEGIPDAEAMVKVVENKIEEHEFVVPLEFEHKLYHVKEGSVKTLRLFAKYPELVTQDTIINIVSSDSESVPVKGRCHIVPMQGSNYAVGEIVIQGRRQGKTVEITASINGDKAIAKVKVTQKDESGAPLRFEIVSKDLGVYRALWSNQNPNLLEISATHDSIKRYLGPEPDYAGQEKPYFRVLLAEIITESLCRKALELEVKTKHWYFKDDFTGSPEVIVYTVLAHLQKRIRDFVATAHSIMLNVTDIK